jgi:XTP/dITP diphosphohydrolase
MNRLLIATNNIGKQKEIRSLLRNLSVDLTTPDELSLNLKVTEDGTTYSENAAKKAASFAKATGLICLADDTGLELEILKGAPGLYSARYSPHINATDADRRAYLLEQLKKHPKPWTAQFRCIIAIAAPSGEVYFSEGICTGEIISNERGSHGFGYDPIFQLSPVGKTMAELSMHEKNKLSHRAIAVKQAIPILEKIFSLE